MMFRAQATPTANVHLAQKWDMIEYETHRYNVRHVKSKIDFTPPMTFMHIFIKPKQFQTDLERAAAIERDNGFLMERLAEIRRKGSWTENRNYHKIRSRNTTSRQKDMMNLTFSNKIMLERLSDTHTSYNRNKLQDEFLFHQKQKAVINKYPPNWRKIRDTIQAQRAEIRRKYVYPRLGVKIKRNGKRKEMGDVKDEDKDNSERNAESLKSEEKGKIRKNSKTGKEAIFTAKGESQSRMKQGTGANIKQNDPSKEGVEAKRTPKNTKSVVATEPTKQISDTKTNIQTNSRDEMVRSSAVEADASKDNGENSELKTNGKEALGNKKDKTDSSLEEK